jgi:hypothetical protein
VSSSARRLVPAAGLLLAVLTAGCSTSVDTVSSTGGAVDVEARTATGTLGVPGAAISGGVGTFTIQPVAVAPPEPGPEQPYLGPWTMARSGERSCAIDLGSRNASGELTARTRGCASVELARVALWNPSPDGVILYDFERKPVATLTRRGPALYEGPLADGRTVTLWR